MTSKVKVFFYKEDSTISLRVKWEVCEKNTFLSLCLAKVEIGV
jgi:hypothetical protein